MPSFVHFKNYSKKIFDPCKSKIPTLIADTTLKVAQCHPKIKQKQTLLEADKSMEQDDAHSLSSSANTSSQFNQFNFLHFSQYIIFGIHIFYLMKFTLEIIWSVLLKARRVKLTRSEARSSQSDKVRNRIFYNGSAGATTYVKDKDILKKLLLCFDAIKDLKRPKNHQCILH
ncbi:hypothetical protein BpHYR1_003764 [Brachionus plicatilis]|uniref:Uncharacterized protein n=1 Tax=Brachionus plicatilis TaxID=10195 RepID=A0A3M7SPK0_BRAPC|nr:hypothetical protein BpHYR1_003764 [Brachionus plicatilis]